MKEPYVGGTLGAGAACYWRRRFFLCSQRSKKEDSPVDVVPVSHDLVVCVNDGALVHGGGEVVLQG